MIEEYYILSENSRKGPYDVVALVRKIRNGAMTKDTLVQQEGAPVPKSAHEWPSLAEFFDEKKDEWAETAQHGHLQHHSLMKTLQSGVHFLQTNMVSTVFSGIFVLIVILMASLIHMLLPSTLRIFGYMSCFILAYFFLSFYLLSILRMTRGQPVDISYLIGKISPVAGRLLLASVLISIPSIVGLGIIFLDDEWGVAVTGLLILAIPGLFMLTLHAFTPLLIFDQGYGVAEAMKISRKSIMKSGMENIGVLFALFVINFIAGLFALIPIAITLPITMSALTEIYDEYFG